MKVVESLDQKAEDLLMDLMDCLVAWSSPGSSLQWHHQLSSPDLRWWQLGFGSSCLCCLFFPWPFWNHGPSKGDEGKEGCNESHEGSEGNVKGSSSWWVGQCNWAQEVWRFQGPEHVGWDRHRWGEEVWQVHSSRTVHDQNSQEGSDQGWQEDDVRQGGDREGQACQDCGQGISRGGFEAANLMPWFSRPWSCSPRLLVAPWGFGAQLVSRAQFAVH